MGACRRAGAGHWICWCQLDLSMACDMQHVYFSNALDLTTYFVPAYCYAHKVMALAVNARFAAFNHLWSVSCVLIRVFLPGDLSQLCCLLLVAYELRNMAKSCRFQIGVPLFSLWQALLKQHSEAKSDLRFGMCFCIMRVWTDHFWWKRLKFKHKRNWEAELEGVELNLQSHPEWT